LAVEALARILSDDSEWRDLWDEAGVTEFPHIDRLRTVFVRADRDPRSGPVAVAAIVGLLIRRSSRMAGRVVVRLVSPSIVRQGRCRWAVLAVRMAVQATV
jgi:hypothetical protein